MLAKRCGRVIISLNEVTSLALKATSGCGYAYGIAEEMAYASRWLVERGLPGLTKLMHALQQGAPTRFALEEADDEMHLVGSEQRILNAVNCAPSIADLLLAYGECRKTIRVAQLYHPVLLLPFIARAAMNHGNLSLGWTAVDGTQVTFTASQQGFELYADDLLSSLQAYGRNLAVAWGRNRCAALLQIRESNFASSRRQVIESGYCVEQTVWHKLQHYAHNTYVPSNGASYNAGAGAGNIDND